ncbi:hypothetical protein PQX77_007294 [Marasmius sp. AFHP31]|nr:hypothetical protein PQX77_007294 [Marasmius sp. AFHP31]
MPPKKKKAKNSGKSISPSDKPKDSKSPIQQNDSLFLKLPVEILTTQILDYFPNVPVGIPEEIRPDHSQGPAPLLPEIVLERSKVLRALAQTCRRLREVCLPLQWEQLDLCAYPHERGYGGSWYLTITKKTERVSEGLLNSPDLASYVRIINVALTRCSPKTVLPAFARCIQALPNLHTLQVVHAHTQITSFIKNGFEGFSFPQIRTVIIPPQAHNLLLSCPEVRRVVCDCWVDSQKLVAPIVKICKKVERLEGMEMTMTTLKRLVKSASNLKYLDLQLDRIDEYYFCNPERINVLVGFKQLTELNMKSREADVNESLTNHKDVIQAAKKLLAKLPTHKERVLKLSSGMEVEPYRWDYKRGSRYGSLKSLQREDPRPRWVKVIDIGNDVQ